jgi:uncharacterized membrane protein
VIPSHPPQRVEGAERLKAFSDGVLAIVITLLLFEVHVPTLAGASLGAVWAGLVGIGPKLVSFAVSFATVAIFWVNHHHFFARITHTNWKVLWLNNLLLFWLTVLPFTTAVIGDYPRVPGVVALYALTLCLAGLSFTLMGYYVFFMSDLFPVVVPRQTRLREWQRSLIGSGVYALAAGLAFVWVEAALVVLAVIPLFFVVPTLLPDAEPET